MAIRKLQNRKSPWQTYWINPHTGKRESECFATEQEAQKKDALIKYQLKFDKDAFRTGDSAKEKEMVTTLEACWLAYLKQKKFSIESLRWQVNSLKCFTRLMSMPVNEITRADLEREKAALLLQDISQATVHGKLSVLRTLLYWSAEQGFMEKINFPKLPPAHYQKLVPPTPEECRAIIASAAPHLVRVIILGAQFGVRMGPCEAFKLTWDDVDLDFGVLRVHGAKKNANSPWRDVPIPEHMIQTLRTWQAEDSHTGCNHLIQYKGKPVLSVKNAWYTALQRAGITRRIRLYDLRHAFATNAIAAGADIGTVAKLMGHSTPTMLLKHYQYVLDSQKKAVVESLPALLNVNKSMCTKKEATDTLL